MTTPDVPAAAAPVRFGDFVLDIANAQLIRQGQPVELPPKSFALLAYLAQRPGELVLKDTLLDAVWGRRFVSEGAIKTVVSELRAALGDDARAPLWIETVQRRGYRFVGRLQPIAVSAARTGAAPEASPCGNLPLSLTPAIAREAEGAALDTLLANHRLVTLTGAAGVGKTRLALSRALARRTDYADGAWLLELAPLAADTCDEATLRATLASALQLDSAAAAANDALVRALRPMTLLLVVDNAEHVLRPLAPLLAHLHVQLPQLHLLVTSREPLHIPGEHVLRLAPLSVPAPEVDDDLAGLMDSGAVRLFVERVSARLPGFAIAAGHQHAVGQLCRMLDGLPLALELAAARVPLLGVNGLVEQLAGTDPAGARLQLLTSGMRTAAPHQRTLRATLDWSHALLTPAQQRVFRRLSVFCGGFTLPAAQALCTDDALDGWAVLDALDALQEKSLLTVTTPAAGSSAAAPAARFGQLESVREYAREQLRGAGELDAICRRHLQVTRAYWQQANAGALTEPALSWTAAHMLEIDNLRSALRWGNDASATDSNPELLGELLALVGHAGALWHRVGLAIEGAQWCEAVRARADAHSDANLRGGVNLALATLSCYSLVRPAAQGLELARRAAAAFAQSGDAVREYFAHHLAWTMQLRAERDGDRQFHIARMQALMQPQWDPMLTRYGRATMAYEQRLQGNHDAYLAYSRQELALRRQRGARWESWAAAHALMLAEHDMGQPEAALATGRAMISDIRAAGRLRQNAMRIALYVMMLAESGDVAATRDMLSEALALLGDGANAFLQPAMGWLALHEGRERAAARLVGWFDAPERTGGHYGKGTYNRRSIDLLRQRLEARLGAKKFAAQRKLGEALGDEVAFALGLGTTDAAN
ncbi:MAG: helix-turn-helix transcriptional regulator [Burkholderiales bacterium]|nr:helix-turn-helix transcriptional regulator [Burkholderiales bacterium]